MKDFRQIQQDLTELNGDGNRAPDIEEVLEAIKTKQDVKKALKKVKGLSDKQLQIISTLPMPVITSIVNNLSMVVADTEKDKPEIKEAPYVAGNLDIVASIIDKIHQDLKKLYVKGQGERAWPTVVALAKMAGYKVSKEKQAKGKMFRYDLKK